MGLNKLNEVNSAELFIWVCYSEEVANLRQEKKKKKRQCLYSQHGPPDLWFIFVKPYNSVSIS